MGWQGPLSYRQLLVEEEWSNQQWNEIDKKEAYLMQIACEIKRSSVKNPNRVKLMDLRLEFKRGSSESANGTAKPRWTKEQVTAMSKAKWLGMMTRKPVEIPTPAPNDLGS